jgi:toxin ParE1/3/4
MTYRVDVTENAKAAINDFISYIAHTKQEPVNAGRVLDAIWAAIPTLETMPHRCPKAPEDAHCDYTVRMLIVKKSLLVLYRVDDDAQVVTVVGFRHGSRLQSPST